MIALEPLQIQLHFDDSKQSNQLREHRMHRAAEPGRQTPPFTRNRVRFPIEDVGVALPK